MESLEKAYFSDKRIRIFWLALVVVFFGILFLQLDILKMLGKEPRIHAGLNFILGGYLALILNSFVKSLFRPKMRVCNHFLVSGYDESVVSWSQITSVTLKGNKLVLEIPEAKFMKKYHISMSFIPDKETLVEDIKKTCETKGIPFEIE
jgi:hypothetical protein